MTHADWNAHYAADDLPWDTGEPDEHLVAMAITGALPAGRALEIGCGTGTNALWLAAHGHDVVAIDVAPRAIERARAKATAAAATRCRFEVLDFLAAEPPSPPFDLVFDRGCFHVFDEPADRARFAARVAAALAPGGAWLSLLGSTEGPPRDVGPPRRSARDILDAIEPVLELRLLRAVDFRVQGDRRARAWLCLAARRDVDAQPSTRR
ncbi:MAG: class I SAM-dependent methyltransferase [Kofleriaceae bacterium]|nr:class I SAM-dependent methyltransferase [Kofleriaceae bacterium]MCB9570802.1 class I SAM-dependent methyltransferase [Kofleriaceae bacterium]